MTPVLNNGLFYKDTSYKVTSNLDSYHLTNLINQAGPKDLGVVDLWINSQKVESPLYKMANFGGKNIIDVDDPKGQYKWRTPVQTDLPYIVENVEAVAVSYGRDETPFKVKFNRRAFGHGDIITYDKYNGVELFITDENIITSTNGSAIYTVVLVNKGSSDALSVDYLQSGTKYMRVGSARGEYGERFSDIGELSTGYREYFNFVGNTEAHANFSVSSRADLILKGGMNADNTLNVTEIWRMFDQEYMSDPSITSIDTLRSKIGLEAFNKAQKSGAIGRTFLTKLEAAHLTKIANDIETYIMWGKGGRIRQDGPDDLRLSVGLWKQLDNSIKRVYNNKSAFSLDMFTGEIFNFYNGKVEFQGPDPKRMVIVQTGMAGMRLVGKAIKNEAFGEANMLVSATDTGAISGKGMDLGWGFAFTHYTIPYLANVKFVLNPALDNVHTNDIENPIIDGFPLSSYSFIIFDITENTNDNIFLLRDKYDNNLRWWYENGTMDYLGRTGFQSSGRFNGYRVSMTHRMPSVWVKDPTKILKIVMRNPITGYSL